MNAGVLTRAEPEGGARAAVMRSEHVRLAALGGGTTGESTKNFFGN